MSGINLPLRQRAYCREVDSGNCLHVSMVIRIQMVGNSSFDTLKTKAI